MAGTGIWTDIAVHRICMFHPWRGSGLLRVGKPGRGVGFYRSKAVAIRSRELSACFESIFCLGDEVGLRVEVERKGPP